VTDALTRLEMVARPLLTDVDAALATLGAPADHEIWALLREVGATPGDAVTFFADLDPLAHAGLEQDLRDRAGAYRDAMAPTSIAWEGGAAEAYVATADALNAHLCGRDGGDSLAGRLAATADYLAETGEWLGRSRDRLARTLGEVLGSAQAVTLRVRPDSGSPATVRAAADIGAFVLGALLFLAFEPRFTEQL